MNSIDRIQFLGVESWRLPPSSPLSLKALPMFLLIDISKPVMDWGVSLLVLWLSDPLLPPVYSSFVPPLHYLKHQFIIFSYLLCGCGERETRMLGVCVGITASFLHSGHRSWYHEPRLLTNVNRPFIRFQRFVSRNLVHSGSLKPSPHFIAILLTNTVPSAKSLRSSP